MYNLIICTIALCYTGYLIVTGMKNLVRLISRWKELKDNFKSDIKYYEELLNKSRNLKQVEPEDSYTYITEAIHHNKIKANSTFLVKVNKASYNIKFKNIKIEVLKNIVTITLSSTGFILTLKLLLLSI